MGTKTSSGATILDKCLRLSVADLKKAGLFVPGVTASTCLRWGEGASITVSVDNVENTVTFDYRLNGMRICYDVRIVERRSNLGRGVVRFFSCPVTHALCRKLYLAGNVFMSRKAIRGGLYQAQAKSKLQRLMPIGFLREDFIPYKRYGKPFYRGRLTPYGKRILRYTARDDIAMEAWFRWLKIPKRL